MVRLSQNRGRIARHRQFDGEPSRARSRAQPRRQECAARRAQRRAPDRICFARRPFLRAKAFELLGLGRDALRRIRTDQAFAMNLDRLAPQVKQDRADGLQPFCVIATAGTVNTGASDDIAAACRFLPRRGFVAPCRRRVRRAHRSLPGLGAAPCRHRTGGFAGFRFSQMAACSLRRRLSVGARRNNAARHFRRSRALSRERRGACRRRYLAVRSRPRTVARLPRAQSVVHHPGARHARARRGDCAQLRAGAKSRGADREPADAAA